MALAGCMAAPPPAGPTVAVSADPVAFQRMQTADSSSIIPPDAPDPLAAQVFLLNDAPINNPMMVARLHHIVDRLLQNWTATPKPQVAIYILPDEGYNGDATGTNQMFVTLGLLQRAQSEDEIAFVLAHELSHILLGHVVERQQGVAANSQMIALASLGTMEGIMLAHHNEQTLDHGATGAVLAAFRIGQILVAANQSVGDAGWSRAQEYQADELGFDLLVKSQYYNPAAFQPVFERLAEEDKTLANQRAALKGTVAIALDQAVEYAMSSKAGGTTILNDKQEAELMGAIMSSPVAEKIIDRILPANSHPPELNRLASLQNYAAKVWPNALPTDDKPNPFTTGELGEQTEIVADALKASQDADEDIKNHQLGEVIHLVYTPGFRRNLPLEQKMLRAQLALAQNRGALAQEMLDSVTSDPSAPASSFLLLAQFEAQNGQTDAALQTLDAGDTHFGNDEPFIELRISLLNQAGRQSDMANALQTCAGFGSEDLMTSCQKAAAPPGQPGQTSL